MNSSVQRGRSGVDAFEELYPADFRIILASSLQIRIIVNARHSKSSVAQPHGNLSKSLGEEKDFNSTTLRAFSVLEGEFKERFTQFLEENFLGRWKCLLHRAGGSRTPTWHL